MDTNTDGCPGYLSLSQQPGNSPSEEVRGHWTPTGCGPMVIQKKLKTFFYLCTKKEKLFCTKISFLIFAQRKEPKKSQMHKEREENMEAENLPNGRTLTTTYLYCFVNICLRFAETVVAINDCDFQEVLSNSQSVQSQMGALTKSVLLDQDLRGAK